MEEAQYRRVRRAQIGIRREVFLVRPQIRERACLALGALLEHPRKNIAGDAYLFSLLVSEPLACLARHDPS